MGIPKIDRWVFISDAIQSAVGRRRGGEGSRTNGRARQWELIIIFLVGNGFIFSTWSRSWWSCWAVESSPEDKRGGVLYLDLDSYRLTGALQLIICW